MKLSKISDQLSYLLAVLGLVAVVHIVNVLTGYQLTQFGLFPRDVPTVWHIVTAPFVHGNNYHLVNNLLGLAVFGSLAVLRSKQYFLRSSVLIILMSGLFVWMFARASIHIGASGWVFGLWSLSITTAFFDKRVWNILVALLVVFFYGGMIYGVLPSDPRVSFEYHLAGALSGVLVAWSLHGRQKRRR